MKHLYEEALADVKKLKEVAEDNAKQAVIEAVAPRIKALIEQQILGSSFDDENDELTIPTTDPVIVHDEYDAEPISPPDEEGKVTLDVDALDTDCNCPVEAPLFGEDIPEEEYILGLEALTALKPLVETNYADNIEKLTEDVNNLLGAGKILRSTNKFKNEVFHTISRVENMYDYIQEHVQSDDDKKRLENLLEGYFGKLKKMSELTMKHNRLNILAEDDSQLDVDDVGGDDSSPGELTLKLTGLPDVDLSDIGVDLISGGSDDDANDDDADDDEEIEIVDDESDDSGEEDLDFGSDDGDDEVDFQSQQNESRKLSDNTIVEIDESMLKREIARMRKLRESSCLDPAVLDDFGDAEVEGDPFLDLDVTTESDEMDDELLDDGYGVQVEQRIKFEKGLQGRLKRRIAAIKSEARKTRSTSRRSLLQKEYKNVAQKFNSSVRRVKVLSGNLNESRSNNVSRRASREETKKLRNQLAEKNLFNTKLMLANKLLQVESLTKRQKGLAIARLDETKTVREAKLVYETLVKTMHKPKSLSESRVIGSSSRATRPGSTPVLKEGVETDRWAVLAGLKD